MYIPKNAIELLNKYFVNRTDTFISTNNKKIFNILSYSPPLESHITGKLASYYIKLKNSLLLKVGRLRLGTYIGKETKFACVDFDGKNHKNSLLDAKKEVLKTYNNFTKANIPSYIEKSYSGEGYHLWIFFSSFMRSDLVRNFCLSFLPQDIEYSDGKIGTVEVFPKSANKNKYGNAIFLPWAFSAEEGNNIFYDSDFKPYCPNYFKTVDKIPDVERVKLLETLDLDKVYGEWLTGEECGEWLKCRDPWFKDENPSAGVCKGGSYERGTFHSFINEEYLSVFDFVRKRGVCEDNHGAAVRYIQDLTGTIPNNIVVPIDESSLPVIFVNNRQLIDIINDSWEALKLYNSPVPKLFSKGNAIVAIKNSEVELVNAKYLYSVLTRSARWMRSNQNGLTNTFPVYEIAQDMIVAPLSLPELDSVISCPIFSRTNKLITESGYDKEGKVWMEGTWGIKIDSDIKKSKELLLNDLLEGFPFVSESDKTHLLCALFLPFIRQLISGPAPLHIIEAPGPGSGKSKLCNLISIIVTGNPCEGRTLPSSDDEIRKMITAELIRSKPIILIDNIKPDKKVDSPSLCSVLTSLIYSDRFLGVSEIVTSQNLALWLATGNNPSFSSEIARRSIRVRIDPKTDQPWRRTGFKHQYIEQWAKDNRKELVSAILSCISDWISKGKCLSDDRLGSFEEWSAILGGLMKHLGFNGFLNNLDEMYENADEEGQEWRKFISCWIKKFPIPISCIELVMMCNENDLLGNILGNCNSERSKLTKLGMALKGIRGKVINGYVINKNEDSLYKLEKK